MLNILRTDINGLRNNKIYLYHLLYNIIIMDEDKFKQKYIEYKKKYIDLKNNINNKNEIINYNDNNKIVLKGGSFPFSSIDEDSKCAICTEKFRFKEILLIGKNCTHVIHYVCLINYVLGSYNKFFSPVAISTITCPDRKDETTWLFVAVNKRGKRAKNVKSNNYPYPFKNLTDASICAICSKNFKYNQILLQGYGYGCDHVIHYMCLIDYMLSDYNNNFMSANDKPVKCPECNKPWQFIGICNDGPGDWFKPYNS